MCAGWSVGNRWPACDLGDGLAGQGEHSGLAGILVAGDQHGLGLLFQCGNGNLLQAPISGCLNGGIQTAQVHIGGDHQGPAIVDGVPDRNVRGRRLVFLFQCGPSQPGAIIRLCHDLKLHCAGIVTGQEMDRKVKASVRTSVGDQLGIGLGVGFQLRKNVFVALTGKDKSPLYYMESGNLIRESGQFIR